MPATYKGTQIPLPTDLADGPKAFQDYTDSLSHADAVVAVDIPAGTVALTCRTTAPGGWVLLDGATLAGAQTTYPNLWNAVPAAWRSGADIILPDCRGRFMVGMSPANAGLDTVGETGGSKTLAVANLPSHSHGGVTGTTGAHTHSGVVTFTGTGGNFNLSPGYNLGNTASAGDHAHTIPAEGGGQDFLPPYVAFNVMMRAS